MKMKSSFTWKLYISIVTAAMLLVSQGNAFLVDFENMVQDYVLEEKQIFIPGYPEAFNPSIVRYNDRLLLSFRILTDPTNLLCSKIGLVWLDDEFNVVGTPQILDTRFKTPSIPCRSEDARIFVVKNRLYAIYNDNEEIVDTAIRRMHLAEIAFNEGDFSVVNYERITRYEGENPFTNEKNWVPFDCSGKVAFAYSLNPHIIFTKLGKGRCTKICDSLTKIDWQYGTLRGGTPAIKINDTQYLAFFHSSRDLFIPESPTAPIYHYVMGAYIFSALSPFEITHISTEPIVGSTFYDKATEYKKVIFPGGYVFDDRNIWVAYGRNDTQCWIVKLDRQGLLESLSALQ